MRQGQQKRLRGRSNNNNNNHNRKGHNSPNRSYESNGPDVKIRGTAAHIADKYIQLARDAQTSGDPIAAENYFQHAEHYYRLLAASQPAFQQHPGFVRADDDQRDDEDETAEGQPNGYEDRGAEQQANGRDQGPREGNFRGDRENYQQRDFGGRDGYRDRRDGRRDQNRGDYQGREGNFQPREGGYQQPPREQQEREAQQDNQPREPQFAREAREEQPAREPREPRPPRQRAPRPAPAPEEALADVGLPAFITGGGSIAPTAAPSEEDGDARPGRGRRRRYGRNGRGGAEGDGPDAPANDAPATEVAGE